MFSFVHLQCKQGTKVFLTLAVVSRDQAPVRVILPICGRKPERWDEPTAVT